jgi:hypothetical protein
MVIGNTSENARPVPGSALAHCSRRPLIARAFAGLDLWQGRTRLVSPLLSQSARITCTTTHQVQLAAIIDGEPDLRAACLAGDLTLARAAQLARESAKWDWPPVEQSVSPVTMPRVIDKSVEVAPAIPELVVPSSVEGAAVESESELVASLMAEVAQLRAELQQVYATF